MTDSTYSALKEYRKRIAGMLTDPDCGGELFSLGVALLDYAVLKTDTDETFAHYADRAWGKSGHWQIRDVLRKDIRRYDAIRDAELSTPGRTCGAPMIRRTGPCGNSATIRRMLTDVDTGRRQWLAACARHREWFDARAIANRAAVDSADKAVIPAANAGGVLARHIPEIDWPALWVWFDPKWTPPPESEPEEVQLRPRLRLVLSGA